MCLRTLEERGAQFFKRRQCLTPLDNGWEFQYPCGNTKLTLGLEAHLEMCPYCRASLEENSELSLATREEALCL